MWLWILLIPFIALQKILLIYPLCHFFTHISSIFTAAAYLRKFRNLRGPSVVEYYSDHVNNTAEMLSSTQCLKDKNARCFLLSSYATLYFSHLVCLLINNRLSSYTLKTLPFLHFFHHFLLLNSYLKRSSLLLAYPHFT